MIDEAVRHIHLNYYGWHYMDERLPFVGGFPQKVRKKFKQIVLSERLSDAINGVGG